MTSDTDLLLIAERLGHALDRIEKIETDLDTQAVPLQASVTAQTSALAALEAALSGIKALNQHVLANDLGALSSRVEEAGKQTETALAALSADISKVSHDLAAKVENVRAELSAVAATRHELSAERQAAALNIEATRNEFSSGLAALRAEIEATAKKFATPQSVNPRGEWVDGEVYSRLDMVSVSGSSYISTIDGNRTKPKSGAAGWMVVAKRGGGGGGPPAVGFAINFRAIPYASTIALQFNDEFNLRTVSLTGNLTLTASGYQAGRMKTIRIVSDASARTLTFPAGWVFIGAKPSATTASKTAILSLVCYGSSESDVVAGYAEQF